MELELRHLRYFMAVAEEKNFSRAAKRLHMSQPSLSKQIQDLEKKLRVKVFDRSSNPLRLTVAGEALLKEAQILIIQLEQTVHKIHSINTGESGHLTISFSSSTSNSIFPEILKNFRQQYPQVALILQEEKSIHLLQRLQEQKTDIIFLYLYSELTEVNDLEIIKLTYEPFVLVVPESHPLTRQDIVSLSDLKDEAFIIPFNPVVSELSQQIYHLCSQANFVPNVAQTAVFMVTILGLVAAEMGVSILPSNVRNLKREGVIYRSILEETPTAYLTAVWRKNNESPILKNFVDLLHSFKKDD
jgi:DNA-binding transcriptional LysR family regulator